MITIWWIYSNSRAGYTCVCSLNPLKEKVLPWCCSSSLSSNPDGTVLSFESLSVGNKIRNHWEVISDDALHCSAVINDKNRDIWMHLPVTHRSETAETVSVVVFVVVLCWPDGRVLGWWRWRMDKMEVVRHEVSGSFLLSSTSASDPWSCSELLAQPVASDGAKGSNKLLKASLLDQGGDEAGIEWGGRDRQVKWSCRLWSLFFYSAE